MPEPMTDREAHVLLASIAHYVNAYGQDGVSDETTLGDVVGDLLTSIPNGGPNGVTWSDWHATREALAAAGFDVH